MPDFEKLMTSTNNVVMIKNKENTELKVRFIKAHSHGDIVFKDNDELKYSIVHRDRSGTYEELVQEISMKNLLTPLSKHENVVEFGCDTITLSKGDSIRLKITDYLYQDRNFEILVIWSEE
jgi:hypothetical protein